MRPTNKTYIEQPATILGLFVLIFLFNNCTYDRTLIYKKDYEVGTNSDLYFDGFYNNKSTKVVDQNNTEYIYPIFFYKDGSVIFMGAIKDTTQLRKLLYNPKAIWGYWGNYKIKGDTVLIETIASYGGSFRHTRHMKKGLIHKGSISFTEEIPGDGIINKYNEPFPFVHFNIKPDSTENWIRKKKKYN